MPTASRCLTAVAAAVLIAFSAPRLESQTAPPPVSHGLDRARLARIDRVVADALAAHQLPGAVVVVGRGQEVVWRKAYGARAIVPTHEPMTVDTIFDLASLTKVIATTTAIMKLVEDGRVRLADPVATYLPECGRDAKARITIRDLLTHTSGLAPDLDLAGDWRGEAAAMHLACDETLVSPPGTRFAYSDIGFILLGEVVARVSQSPLDVFAHDEIFAPLGMRDTAFNPPVSQLDRLAPTERCAPADHSCSGSMLRGVVHDPTARRMGGVAGHAGLFSTADDLTIFAEMLLGGGAVRGARVLSPLTIARMTSPATAVDQPNVRGLGWDLDSSYSANRGELLPLGSFGHTGFTGTSIWIDPGSGLFVIVLSNRVHPDGKGDVTPLRAEIATIAASSLIDWQADPHAPPVWSRSSFTATASTLALPQTPVETGIDVLRASGFAALQGLRVGLVTNATGRARDGASTIDLLARAPGVRLVSLFSPEHGIRGLLDAAVPSTVDAATGLPIHSLYGATERPTAEMLAGLDAIVVDVQDVGARFYTYVTTMAYVMESASAQHVKVIVLDRPNPIGGVEVEGPSLDPNAAGFTGYFPAMPIRHGLTIGELARLFNGERAIGTDLTVVPMKHWERDEWFDETGLGWVNPSPNMRTMYAEALYPGLGAFEGTNVSVGRGTDTPFEEIGAPWIDGARLADVLNARRVPGARFYAVHFTPGASTFAGEECQGVFVTIVDRRALRPVRLGVEVASALVSLFPGTFQIGKAATLFGSADGLARLAAGEDPGPVVSSWAAAEAGWRRLRAKYLLY